MEYTGLGSTHYEMLRQTPHFESFIKSVIIDLHLVYPIYYDMILNDYKRICEKEFAKRV